MVETGWVLEELPAVKAAREAVEAVERERGRIERALLDEQRERAAEAADGAHTLGWLAQLRGQELPTESEVLARGRQDGGFPGDQDRQRRHQAREILRQYGLEDVLGGGSGVILDANMGVLEPGPGVAQRSASNALDAENARLLARYEADRRYIQSISRSRSPFVRRSVAARSESCQWCTEEGLDDQTSFLLHSDPELNVPVTPPDTQAAQGQTDRQDAEIGRLMNLGFSLESARLAATPYGERAAGALAGGL